MKKKLISIPAVLLSVFVLVLLAGCSGLQTASEPLEGQEREAVLAKAEPIADNLFQAMNERSFTSFAHDFDSGMQSAMTEERFQQMMDTLDAKVGKYQSRQVASVEKRSQHYAVIYLVSYEQEANVSWRVVLTQNEPAQVSGLWYDSPKLRAK